MRPQHVLLEQLASALVLVLPKLLVVRYQFFVVVKFRMPHLIGGEAILNRGGGLVGNLA